MAKVGVVPVLPVAMNNAVRVAAPVDAEVVEPDLVNEG
jgi:hypothetical protein